MKKLLSSSRLEIVFSLSLIAILGLPPLVLAQDQKSIEIKIVNGDTTINGKDIRKMSAQERKDALDEMDKLGNITFKHTDKNGQSDIVIRRRGMRMDKKKDGRPELHMFGNENNNSSPYTADFEMLDSVGPKRPFRVRMRTFRRPGGDSTFAFKFDDDRMFDLRDERDLQFNDNRPLDTRRNFRLENDGILPGNGRPRAMRIAPFRMDGPGREERFLEADHPNTQNFNYSVTDNDGINNRASYHVSDASAAAIKRVAGVDKTTLDLADLNLSPEFSTGKTLISFNLPAKTAASIKLTDSDGKALYTDKVTAGSFAKKVSLPRNGVYYLTVKQGSKVAVRKIVKD